MDFGVEGMRFMPRIIMEPFPRVVMTEEEEKICLEGNALNDSELSLELVERAIGLADKLQKPAHLQNNRGFTIHLIYPE